MTDLKQFKYITVLAEELNFSKAAVKLGISQPSLSQFVTNLETELGVKLFDRSSLPMKLTMSGKTYVIGARHILDSYESTVDRIADIEKGNVGKIAVGTSPSLCQHIFPNAVKKLKDKYPNICVNIYEAKTKELHRMLDEGKLDFIFCVNNDERSGCITVPVHEEIILIAVHKSSDEFFKLQSVATDNTVSFKDLKDFSFIALESDQVMTRSLYSLCRLCNIKPNISVSVSEVLSAYAMLKSNSGIALLPSSFEKFGNMNENIAYFKIAELNRNRTIAIQYRKNRYLTKATNEMIEILKNS